MGYSPWGHKELDTTERLKGHTLVGWKGDRIPSTASFDHIVFDSVYVSAQSCPALCDPMACSPPGSSVHEIFQARILGWVAISSSRGSSQPTDRT